MPIHGRIIRSKTDQTGPDMTEGKSEESGPLTSQDTERAMQYVTLE